ncbi:MAG: response regulator, partial [Trichodesmium sp.]
TSGDSLLTIINDILDFSKVNAQKVELEKQSFDLQHCVEDALSLLAVRAREKNLELAYAIAPNTPLMFIGDVARLRQILVNLLSNGIKFTTAGEVNLNIEASLVNGIGDNQIYEIQFAVQDTGIGIASDKMDRLFKSFSQVDSSINRSYGGTGLGLAISKKLTELMGGKIWVESECGKGSTFYFTIIAPSAPETREVNPEAREYLAEKRLLIVDDNGTTRQMLSTQGESWGMLTWAVESGEAAIDLINQGINFDLVILDRWMSGMNDCSLARTILQQTSTQDLPLLLLGSVDEYQLPIECQDINFAAVVNKPIRISSLYQAVIKIFRGETTNLTDLSTVSGCEIKLEQNLKILLAEDNVVNQKVALLQLQELGYRADVAANGIEVLEALRRQPYDVVLMDMQMPEMDGLEATRLIRQKLSGELSPLIIAVTANVMSEDREQCLEVGMDDLLAKPIKIPELVKALEKAHKINLDISTWQNIFAPNLTETNQHLSNSINYDLLRSSKSMLDVAMLESIINIGGNELLNEIINDYIYFGANKLAEIREAIVANDPHKLRMAAHTMRSSSANLGGVTVNKICEELETLGRQNTTMGAAEIFPLIEIEHEQFQQALRNFQHSKNPEFSTNLTLDNIEYPSEYDSVLDLTVLDTISDTKMIQDYLHNSHNYLEEIFNAIAINSAENLQQAAQSLGVNSAKIGAINLANFCEELMGLPGSDLIAEGTDLLLKVDTEYERVIQALRNR